MRYEVDACLETAGSKTEAAETASSSDKKTEIDQISTMLDRLSVRPTGTTKPASTVAVQSEGLVSIRSGGVLVPQESLVEIKSCSTRNIINFNWASTYPQIYLSQTPNIFIGVHDNGIFTEIRKHDLARLTEAHAQCALAVKQLRTLLQFIIDRLRKEEHGQRFTLICKKGELRLYKRKDSNQALPDDLLSLFA